MRAYGLGHHPFPTGRGRSGYVPTTHNLSHRGRHTFPPALTRSRYVNDIYSFRDRTYSVRTYNVSASDDRCGLFNHSLALTLAALSRHMQQDSSRAQGTLSFSEPRAEAPTLASMPAAWPCPLSQKTGRFASRRSRSDYLPETV